MGDINMTPLLGVGTQNDRFLVCEGMPGIKKACFITKYSDGARIEVCEFPQIGHSLPAVLFPGAGNVIYRYQAGDSTPPISQIACYPIEYGGQPDPEYFNIVGVDEQGNPVYDTISEE